MSHEENEKVQFEVHVK